MRICVIITNAFMYSSSSKQQSKTIATPEYVAWISGNTGYAYKLDQNTLTLKVLLYTITEKS